MENEYEQIADLDDLEITPWQRQMRVNKFMIEVRVRELISHMINPVYRNQENLEKELATVISDQISDLQGRLRIAEDYLYNNETRDDKLTRFENKISQVEER